MNSKNMKISHDDHINTLSFSHVTTKPGSFHFLTPSCEFQLQPHEFYLNPMLYLLQSIKEDGELQVWTMDKGHFVSSVSIGIQVCSFIMKLHYVTIF